VLAKIATTLAAVIALTHSVHAQGASWFEVEVFIFERQSNSVEQWPELSAPPKNKQIIDLLTPVYSTDITGVAVGLSGCDASDWASDTTGCNDPMVSNTTKTFPSQLPFTLGAKSSARAFIGQDAVLLSEQQGQFKQLISTLSRERNIQGLAHMTWQQNMQPRRQAKPVRVIGGRDFSKQFTYHGQEVSKSATPSSAGGANSGSVSEYGALGAFSTPAQVLPVWELDGNINIYLSHYLYIETDLFMRKVSRKLMDPNHGELTNFNSGQVTQKVMMPFLQTIPLQQNRRVRSGQIHYFDHPQMGIVMQIRKMAQPTEVQTIVIPAPEPKAVQPSMDPYQQLEQEMQQEAQQKTAPQIKPYEG
jgi:hypothetical protein